MNMGMLGLPFFEEFVWLRVRGRKYKFELSFVTFYNGGAVPKWRNGRRDGLKNHCPKGRVSSTLTFGTTLLATNSPIFFTGLPLTTGLLLPLTPSLTPNAPEIS